MDKITHEVHFAQYENNHSRRVKSLIWPEEGDG